MWNHLNMKTPLKRILAQNVKRLMPLVPEVSTQAKLAVRAHMSQSSVHRILNEQTEPEIETVGKLADAIGVSIGTLLSEGEDEGLPPVLQDRLKKLPPEEREKIRAFIEFVIASHEAQKAGVPTSFTERTTPNEQDRKAAQGLAQRHSSDHTLTSHERTKALRGPRSKSKGA
jgi:transcriptional regulator with XRE-family HTH domain